MSMYTLLRNKPIPNMEDIDTYFQASSVKKAPVYRRVRLF